MIGRRGIVLAFAAATVGLGIVFGDAFVGYERDLQRLLGPGSSAWLEHAQVAGWQPDPNFKPVTYFVRRRADEAIFRRLAGESKLAVRPSAAVPEAIWQLPADMAFPGWAADKVPAGAGLDVRGSIGDAMIFARWYADDLWLVVTPGPQ